MDPDIKKLTDKDGHYMEAYMSNGCTFFKFPYETSFKEHLNQINELQIREDDIFLCAYPKGGTHWVDEIMDMILRGSSEFTHENRGISVIDRFSDTVILDMKSPRVLDTHYKVQFLPKDTFEKKPKVVLVLRNPKDCCVSYYHMAREYLSVSEYEGSFDAFFDMFLEGNVPYNSWFDYVMEWDKVISENSLPVHVLFFEDMKRNLTDTVRHLSAFLGCDLDNTTIEGIAESCEFKNMKKANAELKMEDKLRQWRPGANGFFRKGLVGDWKNTFTVAQNDRFNEEYKRKMANCRHLNRYIKYMI